MHADQDVVDNGLVLEHRQILKGAGNAEARERMGGQLREVPPVKKDLPVEGRNTALIRLKSVVFPAPFGPIRLQICPASTLKLTSLTAVKPPKRLETPTMSRSALTTATACAAYSA
jgi:hypothetical protein